jgi:serine/threonine protein kinase
MHKIGEGTYGCVHREPIKCTKKETIQLKIDYKDKISKLMEAKYADDEMREYALIDRADPKHKFHMEKPVKCKPETSEAALAAIDKCDDFNRMDVDRYNLLIMPDGGVSLNEYVKRNVNKNEIGRFWIEAQRIFYGVKVMGGEQIIHQDFKPHNIVYNIKTKRMNFIDFGFLNEILIVLEKCRQSKYSDGQAHWSFPYEFRFINHADYQHALSHHPVLEGDKQFTYFVEYVTKPGRQREEFIAQYRRGISDMFRHDLKPDNYETFLKRSISTTDLYSVGMSFLYMLNAFESKMENNLVVNLRELFGHMITPRVSLRISVDDALNRYESIMSSSGLLEKHKLKFTNHELAKL